MHAQQRQPVREHVVHLPRDGLAREPLRLLGPQPRLGLGPPRPVPQAQHELPLGPYEHAPADGRGQQHQEEDQRGEVRQVGIGPPPEVQRHGGRVDAAHPGHVPEGPVHGEREQGDDRHAAGGLRDEADRDHRGGQGERPPPAQPDRGAGQRAEHLVGDGQRVRDVGVVAERLGARQAHEHGQQETGEVDGPVPRGAPGPPPGAGRVGVECVEEGGREEPSAPREHRGGPRRLVTSHGRRIYAGVASRHRPAGGSPTDVAASQTFGAPAAADRGLPSKRARPAADAAGAAGVRRSPGARTSRTRGGRRSRRSGRTRPRR